jgi:hypothetical protein
MARPASKPEKRVGKRKYELGLIVLISESVLLFGTLSQHGDSVGCDQIHAV